MSQSSAAESSSVTAAAGAASGAGEFMLFGFRVVADSMRKSVSLNNLSDYKQSIKEDAGAYVSADDAVPRSNGSRDRKRGIPWTEQEHKLFLLGLEKVGKGDWRGISKNFVKTRMPTQVASHAQKYYLRRTNLCRRRRRSSLFDITTESIAATPKKEEHGHCQEHISLQPQLETFKVEGVHVMTPYPVSPTPVMPIIAENPMERLTQGYTDSLHNSASNMVVRPQSILHTPESLIRPDLNLDLNLAIDQSELSLHLSLPSNRSAFQGMPSFINEESMISVV